MEYLVLGANGYIGNYLYSRMKEDNLPVIGTRNRGNGLEDFVRYNVLQDDINDVIAGMKVGEGKTAIFCIGESGIDQCLEDYDRAYAINVKATQTAILKLHAAGFHIIFFSTDNVFDGKKGNYLEEDDAVPINDYGKMKLEMERFLLQSIPKVCIFRLSKVVGTKKDSRNLFTQWEEQARQGRIICIRDNILSLLCLEDVYQACLLVEKRNLHGLYHIAGDQAYSRILLAEKFCRALGKEGVCIEECEVSRLPVKEIRRPLNVSMCSKKFKSETSYQFITMEDTMCEYAKNRSCQCKGRM